MGFLKLSAFLEVDPSEIDAFVKNNSITRHLTTGALTPDRFVDNLNKRFGSKLITNDIVDIFSSDIDDIYEEIPPLVSTLKKRYFLGILSNTFFGHWDSFISTNLAGQFNVLLGSHLLGHRKPEKAIFLSALDKMNAIPEEVLFIDDLEENVAGAISVGMHSFQTNSPEETIDGLKKFNIEL